MAPHEHDDVTNVRISTEFIPLIGDPSENVLSIAMPSLESTSIGTIGASRDIS